ncbi:hypothetical protein JCGZ_25249 [Jatropha curcas]|uniref:Uncharacterized protein n=1 Tax=Jatropha curcas TaxID=180498 RepID=A0A067L735_JATCU|nr:hypothetical protein JCGZ_25249 [Jatropha curcas]
MESHPVPEPSLERQLSIESEPKTLFDHDMNAAREAALKILAEHSEEEALKIFLEGLMPVTIAVNPEWEFALDDVDEECNKKN